MSFRDYYAVGVLEQVQQYIRDNLGEEPENYRVVSLGIDPAAALYHGFYCLDGYSNNYDLAYKHRFREIIAPELDKSEYLTEQFDGWATAVIYTVRNVRGIIRYRRAASIFRIMRSMHRACRNWADGICCRRRTLIIVKIRGLS